MATGRRRASRSTSDPFAVWGTRWDLIPDGDPLHTPSSDLLPALAAGLPSMLKLARDPTERRAGPVLRRWAGDGAARVLAWDHAEGAMPMERAASHGLVHLALEGRAYERPYYDRPDYDAGRVPQDTCPIRLV